MPSVGKGAASTPHTTVLHPCGPPPAAGQGVGPGILVTHGEKDPMGGQPGSLQPAVPAESSVLRTTG